MEASVEFTIEDAKAMTDEAKAVDDTAKEEQAEEQPTETEASFRRKYFERVEDIWSVAAPIAIRNLSVPKDASKKGGNGGSSDLKGAPNFMTAIVGSWLANKLGCGGPPPENDGSNDQTTPSASDKYVISNISAVLNPGEATLIIAPSSSGKTTLMRTIANICEGRQVNMEGTVMIGGCDPLDPQYKGCFSRSTAMADQGDLTLTPVLTVEETLRFTSSCASDGTEDEVESEVSAFLRLAGLSHVADTVVGDAEIRGVSGGQKRRVKVMEQCVGNDVKAIFMDEITNGLDSASALASCQNVNVAVEKTGITAMVCLLQPSIDMYNEFHRIVVLTQNGEMAYSGPRDKALAHFESLGLSKPADMDEPEFLLRCAFKPEDCSGTQEGETNAQNTPPKLTSTGVASRFSGSAAGKALTQELDTAESTRAEGEPKVMRPFPRSFWKQLSLLLGRGWKLVLRDPGTFFRVIFAILFGLFVGTLFLNTPGDVAGTRTRAGYAFSMLMLMFMTAANSPMEANYKDRGTFYCHRQANFYYTKSYYISTMICSWPVTITEATLLSICSFFLVRMESYGGPGFLYFWLIAIVISLCGSSISRVLSYGLPSNDVAAALGPAILMLFTMTAGFAPQYPDLPNWLFWLSWLSPCAYALEGILVNELYMRDIADTDPVISGTEFGQEVMSIPRIPYDQASAGMKTPGGVMAFDVYVLVAFTILFEILGCVILHASQKWYGPTTKRYQVTSGMCLNPFVDIGAINKGKEGAKLVEEREKSSVPPAPPAHLTAQDIVYEVDVKPDPEKKEDEKEKETDSPKSGNTPTTRTSVVDSEAVIPITAREYGQARQGVAQEWVLKRALGEGSLSLRSTVSSTGPNSIRVDELAAAEAGAVDDLDPPAPGRLRLLSGITATFSPGTMTALMGSSGAGKTTLLDVLAGYKTGGHIGGNISLNGAPKTDDTWRLIAGYCEQTDLHNPALTVRESLIFATRMRLRPFSLTEDARTSYCEDNMRLLELELYADILVGDEAAGQGLPKHARKRLTLGVELSANPSILFADEPTSGLDSLSASLVVSSLRRIAQSRGVTVVCTIHQPSKEVFETFDNLLLLMKGGRVVYNGPIAGISNYLTSASGNDAYALKPGTNPADHALDILCGPGGQREDWAKLYRDSTMAADIASSCEHCQSGGIDVKIEYRGTFSQLTHLLQRQMLAHWRTPSYMSVRFWWTFSASLLVGLIFANIPNTADGAFNLVGAIFNFVNLATVPLMSAAVPLIMERAVYYREISSGTYRKSVYAMAVELAELPFNLLMALVSWVIFYWLIGLDSRVDRVFYNLLMTFAVYWVLPLFGQLFSFVSPNVGIAAVIGGVLLVAFTLTMGFLIAPENIPPWWIWVYWINPLRYVLQGLAVNELGDGKEYLSEGTGEYVSGDDLLANLGGWSFDQRWWYCYIVVLLFGFAASAGLLGATRINWMKR